MKPCWNLFSLALPLVGLAVGAVVLNSGGSRGGDWAGAMGSVVMLALAMGVVCVAGEAAAIYAFVRGERMAWLSVLGGVVNAVVILPAAYLTTRIQ